MPDFEIFKAFTKLVQKLSILKVSNQINPNTKIIIKMKKVSIILCAIAMLNFTAQAQIKSVKYLISEDDSAGDITFNAAVKPFKTINYSLFLQGGVGMQDNLFRAITDLGVQINNKYRITLYAETFQTQHGAPCGYRKFFLGTRYSYILPLTKVFQAIPNIGADMRLSGGNMVSVRPQFALQAKVDRTLAIYVSTGYQLYDNGGKNNNPRTRAEAGVNVKF